MKLAALTGDNNQIFVFWCGEKSWLGVWEALPSFDFIIQLDDF